MRPFERAGTAAGPLVAAWDYEDDSRTRLLLFAVGDEGVEAVAETTVPLDRREQVVDQLVERQIRIGATHAGKVFVWVVDEQGFTVWGSDGVLASGAREFADVVDVTLFVDPADSGHRGVRLTRSNGQHTIVVEEHDAIPRLDPAYGNDDLFLDSLWALHLGQHLALWLLVPFVDEVSGGSFAAQLAIARAARLLADQIDGADASGDLVASMGPIGRATQLALRVDAARRSVELVVASGGGVPTSVTIKAGTSAMVVAFLRRVSTPGCVLWAMNGQLPARDSGHG